MLTSLSWGKGSVRDRGELFHVILLGFQKNVSDSATKQTFSMCLLSHQSGLSEASRDPN